MSATNQFNEILPKYGQLHIESIPTMVLCKPKMMPLKSVTLERLEKMQRDIQEEIRQLKGRTKIILTTIIKLLIVTINCVMIIYGFKKYVTMYNYIVYILNNINI